MSITLVSEPLCRHLADRWILEAALARPAHLRAGICSASPLSNLVLLDLTFLKDVYRIVSFLVLGLLMLAASYIYHRLEKRLTNAAAV